MMMLTKTEEYSMPRVHWLGACWILWHTAGGPWQVGRYRVNWLGGLLDTLAYSRWTMEGRQVQSALAGGPAGYSGKAPAYSRWTIAGRQVQSALSGSLLATLAYSRQAVTECIGWGLAGYCGIQQVEHGR